MLQLVSPATGIASKSDPVADEMKAWASISPDSLPPYLQKGVLDECTFVAAQKIFYRL